jgi:tetratricopeptide (TPR) repeat protein
MEEALEAQGMVRGSDFLVIADREEFANWQPCIKKPILIKLNGSLHKPESTRQIFEVYDKGLGLERVQILSYILQEYYCVFLESDKFLNTFVLETLPCSCPGIACISSKDDFLTMLDKAKNFYRHDITFIQKSQEAFLLSLEKQGTGQEIEQDNNLQNIKNKEQGNFLALWAKEAGVLGCHEILATLADKVGEHQLALECREEALHIAKTQMNAYDLSKIFIQLGDSYTILQDTSLALQYFEKSVNILQKLNQGSLVASVYLHFGDLYFRQQQWALSISHYERALKLYGQNEDQSNIPNIAETHNKSGNACEKQEKFGEALSFYEKSIEFYQKIKENAKIGKIYNQIGRVYFQKKELKKAEDYYSQSQYIAANCGDIEALAHVYANLAVLLGEEQKARKLYERAGVIFEQLQENEGAAVVYYNLALLKQGNNDLDGAKKCLLKALSFLDQCSNKQERKRIQELLWEWENTTNSCPGNVY